MSRFLACVLTVVIAVGPVVGQDVAVARAKAAALLTAPAAEPCHDLCPKVCAAKFTALLMLSAKPPDCTDDLADAAKRAAKEKRPLFLWVGMTCVEAPAIRKAFPAAVHCHVAGNLGDTTPRLLVGPGSDGRYWVFAKDNLGKAATAETIRAVLTPAPAVRGIVQSVTYAPNAIRISRSFGC